VRDYAFQVLHLPKLVSLIDVGNIASRRVPEKAGMRFEAAFERYGNPYWQFALTHLQPER
jgi:RimJ/RimL family protein N-acetyltransferase